ncbi:MKI67 FHA domain-interacting nucleolar phosphoprotein [Chanos chanos]|uniref:MKI67 FHA domain-interacting nucleolar phosphoprotein n=1 Tax=Chanos chanos TaxID=29144 RepID=A0A6J2WFL1_CHACN|nr:MKI67 FHA domain-interacting nucleolar phosphoprotein [Chanos chanos]
MTEDKPTSSTPNKLLALNPSDDAAFRKKVQQVKQRQKKPQSLTRGVIYVGHLPRGLFEPQLRSYFQQFGNVTRLRLSRSKKTGGSKGYAFVEFECDEVAKIVAETMDNYLMGERLIQCHIIPPEKVHERLFVGCDRQFRKPKRPAVLRYNKMHLPKDVEKVTSKLVQKESKLRKRLAEKGIDYDFPGFASQVAAKKALSDGNTSVCSEDATPVCTPSVLERRKSAKFTDDDEDNEIIIKAMPKSKSKNKDNNTEGEEDSEEEEEGEEDDAEESSEEEALSDEEEEPSEGDKV